VTSDPEFKVTTFCVVKYQKNLKDKVTIAQGWAQGSFVEAEAEVEAARSRQRRGKAAMSLIEARQRQTARGRGEAD